MLLFVFIGSYSGRRVKQLDDYFVAGRRAPTLLIVGTLVASVFSTSIFLGEAGFTYDGQLGPYMLMPGIAVIGYVYGAFLWHLFTSQSRRHSARLFWSALLQPQSTAGGGLHGYRWSGGYLLVVTQGAAILLSELTQLSYLQGIVLAWLSYTAFTLYSGSRGVIITDTLMFLLFCGATVFFVVLHCRQHGWRISGG